MARIRTALKRYQQSQPGKNDRTEESLATVTKYPYLPVYSKPVHSSPTVFKEHRLLNATPPEQFLEAYKIVRTQLLLRIQEQKWTVIGITSPGQKEGKTLVAANLAVSLAMGKNHNVVLIDANLRNPNIHRMFGLENRGLADYLLDEAPLNELLIDPNIDRLVVVPAGGPIKHSLEALTLPKMTEFVDKIKQRFASRIVIFDLPPLLNRADVLGFAPLLDAITLVVEEGRTTIQELEQAVSLLKGVCPLVGTVLNKAGRLAGSTRIQHNHSYE